MLLSFDQCVEGEQVGLGVEQQTRHLRRQRLEATHRIEIGAAIADADGVANTADLADQLGIKPQTVNHELGRLEEAGLLHRTESPERKVFLRAIDCGFWSLCQELRGPRALIRWHSATSLKSAPSASKGRASTSAIASLSSASRPKTRCSSFPSAVLKVSSIASPPCGCTAITETLRPGITPDRSRPGWRSSSFDTGALMVDRIGFSLTRGPPSSTQGMASGLCRHPSRVGEATPHREEIEELARRVDHSKPRLHAL